MAKKKKKKKKAKKKSTKKTSTKKTVVEVPSGPKITPYPEAGKKVQDFEDNLDRQLAGGPEPEEAKRGRGRPPKEKLPEPEQPELTIDIVAGVIKIPFEIWAIGEDLKKLALEDDEARRIAEPARQLLEFYLPKIPVIAYAWVSLSVGAFWSLRTRLLLIQEIKKQNQKQQQAAGPVAQTQTGVIAKFPDKVEPEKI